MTSRSSLSSEQALDDYFSALLEESIDEEQHDDVHEALLSVVSEPEIEPVELEPLVQSVEEKSYYRLPTEEIEVPKLDDVERLLRQLESTNPVAELELEEVMEQNTVNIAQVQTKSQVEEVQEWDVEEVAVETIAERLIVEETELDIPEVEIEEPQVEIETTVEVEVEVDVEVDVEVEPQLETQAGDSGIVTWQSTQRENDFQVLYFDVNNVTFAVPLDELGGIHRIAELNHLIGRPDWYLGLQTSREAQLDVVDTAKWVMSEKLKDDSHKEKYQYIVMLGESMWGLASTELMGTESLNPEMVRWRETAGKRPWLAGMVKEKMCALVHVEALIAMLNAGLDVKALDS